MSKFTKKIGSDPAYKRPKKTMQEQLTAEEIAEKLQGYERVDDINEVPINTHLRYFTTEKDGTQVFRMGGFLQNKQNADKYVYLSNGKISWSVQTDKTIFFRKLSHTEEIDALHRHYKKKLAEKDIQIEKFKRFIKNKMGSKGSSFTVDADDEQYDQPETSPAKPRPSKTKSSKTKSSKPVKKSSSKTSKKTYRKKRD